MNTDLALSLEFIKSHPVNSARVLERMPMEDTASFLNEIPLDIAAGVMRHMDSLVVIRCSELMEPGVMGSIAELLPLEIASMILRKMNSVLKNSVMNAMSPDVLEDLKLLLRFPEGTAGALMDPRYFVIPKDIHVNDAIRRARHHLKQNASTIYVVTRDQMLEGFIHMHEILPLEPKTPISSIIHTDLWKVSAYSDRQQILMNPGWKDVYTLPVVDDKNIFLGAIDYQTIRRLEQDMGKTPERSPLKETSNAIGELFWVGLSGLVGGVVSAIGSFQEQGDGNDEKQQT